MAINLKEYVRESIIVYLTKIKATMYTKTQVDTIVDAIIASDVKVTNYVVATAATAIASTDNVSEALGKLEKRLNDLPDMATKADLVAGKVPISQLPETVLGSLQYQGTWNADTNIPNLTSGNSKGDYYVVSADGSTNLDGEVDWKLGDWVVYDGTAWSKLDRSAEAIIVTGNSIVAPFTDVTSTDVDNDWDNS